NIISPKLNCLHILRSSLSTYILLSRREKLQNMVSEKPVVIFSKNSCCMSHSIKTLFVDFGVNPTIYDPTVPVVFIGGQLVGGANQVMSLHLNRSLVPMLKRVGVLWRNTMRVYLSYNTKSSKTRAGRVFMSATKISFGPSCVPKTQILQNHVSASSSSESLHCYTSFHIPSTRQLIYSYASLILSFSKSRKRKNQSKLFEATVSANPLLGSEEHNERDEGALKYLNDIKLNSNPYLKNTVVNKTNHMIEDESILEKAIGHGMAFPKSSFTKGKWSTTMISGEAVATNDLEMDEVQ
ncbi:hypothetical protein HID58_080304, partial [Brassica napus]